MDQFDGDTRKFRGWSFDLMVAIGQVGAKLAQELMKLMQPGLGDKVPEKWTRSEDFRVSQELHQKYYGEFYGLLVSLCVGDAKAVLSGSVRHRGLT